MSAHPLTIMSTLAQLNSSRELLWNLTLRELRTKYRRSVLGWTWSLLNPLATVVIYGFVFGTLFGSTAPVGDPSGLDNFALYLLCALLPWNFFTLVQNTAMGSIIGNAGLVRKVAFPREVLVLAQVGHGLVQFSIEMSLLAVVLADLRQPDPPVAAGHDPADAVARRVRRRHRHGAGGDRRVLPRSALSLGHRAAGVVLRHADRVPAEPVRRTPTSRRG